MQKDASLGKAAMFVFCLVLVPELLGKTVGIAFSWGVGVLIGCILFWVIPPRPQMSARRWAIWSALLILAAIAGKMALAKL